MTTLAAIPGRTGHQRRRRLGEVLIEQGALTREELARGLAEQRRTPESGGRRRRLGQVLIELELITERELIGALSVTLGYPVVDLGVSPVDHLTARLLPRAVAMRHVVVPLDRTPRGGLRVAVADPTDVMALDDVRAYTGVGKVELALAPTAQIRDALARVWSLAEDASDVATMFEDLESGEVEDPTTTSEIISAPTVRLVNVIIADAVRLGASDIHVEPQARDVRIRYRIDGLLREVMSVPRAAAPGLVSRIKVLANLDIAERRLPQDGRARLQAEGAVVDTRVSTLPSIHGEKVVIRLLARSESIPALPSLGLNDEQLDLLRGALASPQGLVLITGPTGSGKTNTLYAAVDEVKCPELNVVTLEDPVEVQLSGVTQVQVNDRTGFTFARGLRSVLRQDPDVLLVGEIRDIETAKLALEASLTGHLVLATLHTNHAAAALTRLVDMGVEPYLVGSSLSLVVAQRLVRRVCDSCVTYYVPSPRTLEMLGLTDADLAGATPRRGKGCADCTGVGFRGRTGVFEMIPVTAALRSVLLSNPTEAAVTEAVKAAGASTLRDAALAKAMAGVTTFEEVLRVTPWDRDGVAIIVPRRAASVRPRILVVDDDPAIRAYVAMALVDSMDVDAAADLDEARARLADTRYDGVVVDQRLAEMTGLEFAGEVKERHPETPVMLLTGFDEAGLAEAARAAGVFDVVLKPVEPLALEERALALVAAAAG